MRFISIIMGSKSDYPIMIECEELLKRFDVKYELIIASAHRTPERTKKYVIDAEKRGAKVFIAGAGMAAHLAGVISSLTTRPVLGVPIPSGDLKGQDSLLSTVMMPAGFPVGTLAIGKAGAKNSAYLAMQILSIDKNELEIKIKEDRINKIKQVELDSLEIETLIQD